MAFDIAGWGLIPLTLGFTLLAAGVTFLLRKPEAARNWALVASLVPLLASVWMFRLVDLGATGLDPAGFALYEKHEWLPAIGVSLSFGVDGLAQPMVFLTALLTTLVLVYHWRQKEKAPQFYGLFLLLEFALMGVFTVLDYVIFYIFWELVLIPMFFLIAIWGGPNRRYAAVKFFLYTFIASLFMLVALMAIYFKVGETTGTLTFDMLEVAAAAPGVLTRSFQTLVFGGLFIGFATKLPSVPVHTWLPDAHVQAPTGGSVMLAGVLLKMGLYGILRIALPTLPEGTDNFVPVMLALGLVSLLWAAVVALGQRDLKSMIAYSSISHMGIALVGVASLTQVGLVGAMFMMFAHGIISGGLFMTAGIIQHGTGTRIIQELGGIGKLMPTAIAVTMVLFMASLGLPGLAGFVAEILLFISVYQAFGLGVLGIAVLAVPLTAGYYLYAAKRAFFGPLGPLVTESEVHDAPWHEISALFALAVLSVLFGVLPALLTGYLDAATTTILSAMGVGA